MSVSSSVSSSITTIPFNGKDFPLWKIKVQAYIGGQGWTKVISALVKPDPDDKKDDEPKVFAFLVNSLSYSVLSLFASVAAEQDPRKLWQALVKHYERDTMASKHATRAVMMSQRLAEGEDVSVYVSRITSCAQKLLSMGDVVSEDDQLFCLLNGLPESYDSFKYMIRLKDQVTFATAVQHLKDQYEMSRLKDTISQDSTALFAGHRQKYGNKLNTKSKGDESRPWCAIHKSKGHSTENCFSNKLNKKHQEKKDDKKGGNKHGNVKCFKCGLKGHFASTCTQKKKKPSVDAKGDDDEDEKGSLATHANEYSAHAHDDVDVNPFDVLCESACASECDDVKLQASLVASMKGGNDVSEYILDSGATSHYINDLSVLHDIINLSQPKSVTVANNEKVTITKIGTMKLPGDNGVNILLKDARYVPSFTTNLVSVSRLTKNGAHVMFTKDVARLVKDGQTLLTAKRHGELYYINYKGRSSADGDRANKVSDDLSLYHQRAGHLSLSSIKRIVNADAVVGINHLKSAVSKASDIAASDYVCDGCAKGKSHRTAFLPYSLKPVATDVCFRIYCDLSGPIKLKQLDGMLLTIYQSLGSPLYFSAIVDEKSRYMTGALLKSKTEAADQVIKWITYSETLQQKPVKYFHSDGGGEYINKKLLSFFDGKGIKVEQTCADTPQHNGVVERANRIVFEMARSMMMHANLPVVFWGEAVLTACYLMNIRLCVTDKTKTAYEVWHGHKPLVQHLRVFGCDVYVHIHKDHRKKMDAKATKGIFIGYDRNRENGYRVYDIVNHRVMISRDVKFFEKSFTAAREVVSSVAADSADPDVTATILSLPSPWEIHLQRNPPTSSQPPSIDLTNSQSDVENKHQDAVSSPTVFRPASVPNPSTNNSPTVVQSHADPAFVSSLTWVAPPTLQQSYNPNATNEPQHKTQSGRTSKPPTRFFAYSSVDDDDMPQTYVQAMKSADSSQWKKAVDEEIASLNENDTFTYVKRSALPAAVNIMDYRWLFRVKLNSSGGIERYKARLVAKGFTQKEGIDYNETYAPVVRYKSLRIILALANIFNYELKQMDVITAFLNAKVDEDVYMRVPEGFDRSDGHVLKLNKSLYGTKQAPHMWNNELNAFIVSIGFVRLVSDSCVYVKRTQTSNMIIISIFVDDIVSAYASGDEHEWLVVKKSFMSKYKMKDLGDVNWILGMKLCRDRVRGVLSLDQSLYLNKVLDRFGMSDCKPVSTPECT